MRRFEYLRWLVEAVISTNGYDRIKKVYGETAAKLVRTHCSVAIDHPDEFLKWAAEKIPVKKSLAKIIEADPELLSRHFKVKEKEDTSIKTNHTAETLAKQHGYKFIRIKDFQHLLKFKKDYRPNETICSYRDENRPVENFIFHVRKLHAEKIPPADELTPENLTPEWKEYLEKDGRKNPDGTFNLNRVPRRRQDPYGTSVINIQVNRKNGFLKMINRYNHGIDEGPSAADNAFNLNLDKFISGFRHAIDVETGGVLGKNKGNSQEDLTDLVVQDPEGRFFFPDGERNGITYGDGFVIENGVTRILDPNSERVIEGIVVKSGEVCTYVDGTVFADLFYGSKITVAGNTVSGVRLNAKEWGAAMAESWGSAMAGSKWVAKIDGGKLIEYYDTAPTFHGDAFSGVLYLKSLDLPQVKTIGNDSLSYNAALTTLSLPQVTSIGDDSLRGNAALTTLSLPQVTSIGNGSLSYNAALQSLSLPQVTSIGSGSLDNNAALKPRHNSPSIFSTTLLKTIQISPNSSQETENLLRQLGYEVIRK